MTLFSRSLLLGAIFLASTTASAAPPPDFANHVRAGDRARAQGRLNDAVVEYVAALKLQDDPVVLGRLGLVLFRQGHMRLAATMLVRALEDQAALPPAERAQVAKAFEAVRLEVCRLTIRVNRMGAELSIDGRVIEESATGADVIFVDPGEHTITARLEGYEEASQVMTAEKGGVATVSLELRAIEAPPAPPPPPSSPPPAPASRDEVTAKRSPFLPSDIAVSAGAGTVWGLAPSAAPALGPSASASLRWKVTPSVMVSVAGSFTAFWSLPAGQQGTALYGDAYVGGIHGCGQWRWVFGCALVNIATVEYRLKRDTRQDQLLGMPVIPALGIGGGVELPYTSRFRARLRGEIARALRQPSLTVDGRTAWMAPGFIGGVTLEGVVAFGL